MTKCTPSRNKKEEIANYFVEAPDFVILCLFGFCYNGVTKEKGKDFAMTPYVEAALEKESLISVRTEEREVEGYCLRYTIFQNAALGDAMPAYTLRVTSQKEETVQVATLEDVYSTQQEAEAFFEVLLENLVFPEHLYEIWEETLIPG